MSQCQMCGRTIPDGQQYCPTCRNAVEWRQRQQSAQRGQAPAGGDPARAQGPRNPAHQSRPGPAEPQKTGGSAKAHRPVERGRGLAVGLGIVLVLFLAFFAAALILGGGASSNGGQGSATLTQWDGGGAVDDAGPGPEQVTVTAPEALMPQEMPAAPEGTAGEDLSGEYIFPNSDSTYLTREEVAALSPDQLRLARNEIYARHGRIFQDEALAAYFGSKSWYQPLYDPESFDALGDSILNEYEIANRDLIREYEQLSSASPTVEQGGE